MQSPCHLGFSEDRLPDRLRGVVQAGDPISGWAHGHHPYAAASDRGVAGAVLAAGYARPVRAALLAPRRRRHLHYPLALP